MIVVAKLNDVVSYISETIDIVNVNAKWSICRPTLAHSICLLDANS